MTELIYYDIATTEINKKIQIDLFHATGNRVVPYRKQLANICLLTIQNICLDTLAHTTLSERRNFFLDMVDTISALLRCFLIFFRFFIGSTMTSLFLIAGIILLAAISPGPDFVVVMKHIVGAGRKAALRTTLGITLGNAVHVTYCIIGIGAIVAQSIVLFHLIKILGAIYLLYLAVQLLRTPRNTNKPSIKQPIGNKDTRKNWYRYIKEGFLVNLLNPKATIFILSLFTQTLPPSATRGDKLLIGGLLVGIVGGWFTILSYVGSYTGIQSRIHSIKRYIEKTMGGLLAIIGVKVLFEK